MQSKVSKKGNFERVVEVDIPEAELAPHFEKMYKKYQRSVKLEGFRKGKVPLGLIKKLYGDAIKTEAIDEVVQSVFQEVKAQESLKPVAPAQLEDIQYKPEEGLHFKATVEVVPDIELKTYTGLSVEKEVYQVDDEDVGKALEDIREQMALMQPVEGEAREGHFVLADLQQVDEAGLPIIGKKYEDRFFQLNTDEFNKELAEQLIGVKPGETRRIELPMQQDGSSEPKLEWYSVQVKEIKEKKLPALDDELAKDLGKFETLDELKEDIRTRLRKQAENDSKRRLRRNLIDELLKKNDFELPESMIQNYLEAVVESAQNEQNQQLSPEQLKQQYRPSAIWNLKWELAKDKLVELENIQVTEEAKNRYIADFAERQGMDEKEVRNSLRTKAAQKRLEEGVLEKLVLDFLEQNAKIKEKKITRKDVEKAQKISVPA